MLHNVRIFLKHRIKMFHLIFMLSFFRKPRTYCNFINKSLDTTISDTSDTRIDLGQYRSIVGGSPAKPAGTWAESIRRLTVCAIFHHQLPDPKAPYPYEHLERNLLEHFSTL